MRSIKRMTLILFATVLASSALAVPASAQDAADVKLDSPIRSITLDPNETRIDLDIDFFNYADSRRIVTLAIDKGPEMDDWDVDIWNAFFDFRISEMVVQPTEETPGQRPRLRIRMPNERPEPGTYGFTLTVADKDDPGIVYDVAEFTIGVPEAAPEEIGEITLRADFPNLQGPPGTAFEFEVIIGNETDEEQSVALDGRVLDANGQPVQGWDLGFTPAFGEAKRISSVGIQPSLDERVNVQVTPLSSARPGEYLIPVAITAADGLYSAERMLALRITGRGELLATTQSGRLSVNATAGETATVPFRLTNFGTGDLANVALSLDNAPSDWVVEFEIDNVENLPVSNEIVVKAFITPPDDAVPGDYEVTLRGRALNATDAVTLRVTVEQSTIWGWLGIVLVIIVVGSLLGLFWRLGRR